MRKHDVSEIAAKGLCMACGCCEPLCPSGAIRMVWSERASQFLPFVDQGKCTKCGQCSDVCPGGFVDFDALHMTRFGKLPENALHGNWLGCHTGHAADPEVRSGGASGGMVRAMICHALRSGHADAALVAVPGEGNPFRPTIEVLRDPAGSKRCQGSIYLPVPLGKGLEAILRDKGRYVVVGLPCHVHGILKAMGMRSRLRDRIVLILGLICGGTPRGDGLRNYLKFHKIDPKQVDRVDFRYGKWPGSIRVSTETDTTLLPRWKGTLPLARARYGACFRNYMDRCTMCCDKINEFADIVFGDPWLPEFDGEKEGTSMVISRTPLGKQLLGEAQELGEIVLQPLPVEKSVASMGDSALKKAHIGTSISIFRMLGDAVPVYVRSYAPSEPPPASLRLSMLTDVFMHRIFRSRSLHGIAPWAALCRWMATSAPRILANRIRRRLHGKT